MTADVATNNRRIARNTVVLYLRMLFMTVVALFTSRYVLKNLGVDDFGTYNVVGGIVVLFSFVNGSMVQSTMRFLNYHVGRGESAMVRRVFSMSLNVHLALAFLVVLVGETVGLWLLNHYLNIPTASRWAAGVVYQMSLLTTFVGIIVSPYKATIIAFERMHVFAWLSIFEAVMKLATAMLIVYVAVERLAVYAVAIAGVHMITLLSYYVYNRRRISVSAYSWERNVALFRRMVSFSFWSLFGSFAMMSAYQVVSLVQNFFGGVVINAAMGVANQVNGCIYSLSSNFQMAFNPQITKYYAADDIFNLRRLTFISTKISFYLVWLLSLPVLIYCTPILHLWLTDVPQHAVTFCRLIILCSLFDALSAPLWMNVQATGRIKRYQVIVSIIIFLNLPLSWFCLRLGLPPWSVLMVRLLINAALYLFRSLYLRSVRQIPLLPLLQRALLPCLLVAAVSAGAATLLLLPDMHFFLGVAATLILTAVAIFTLGLNGVERRYILFLAKGLLKGRPIEASKDV